MRIKSKITLSIISGLIILTVLSAITYNVISGSKYTEKAKDYIRLLTSSFGQRLNLILENYAQVVDDFSSSVIISSYIPDAFREEKRLYPEFSKFIYTTETGKATNVYPFNLEWKGETLLLVRF